MLISRAEIRLGNESYPEAPFPSVIVLDEDADKLVDCVINQGEIVARGKKIVFTECHIVGKKPTILGEFLSQSTPTPNIHRCRIVNTKLPDAYYSGCYLE